MKREQKCKDVNKREQYKRSLRKIPHFYEMAETIYEESGEEPEWAAAFCYVMAPALMLFTAWVVKDAIERGKRRLYFLARDGYMMYQAAAYWCERLKLPLECRYLYCSRYALRCGEYKLLGERSMDYIGLGGMQVTLEKLLMRGGLSCEEAAEAAEKIGMQEYLNKPLSKERIHLLAEILKKDSFFYERMIANAEREYPKVTAYLRQEGLLDDIPCALVDSGWTGSMQKSIGNLLQAEGFRGEVEGYYFGMYQYAGGVDFKLYHPWYFKPRGFVGEKVFFCNNLFECIFSSPEGMTIGYRQTEYGYEPVISPEGNQNSEIVNKSAGLIRKYAEAYAASGMLKQLLSSSDKGQDSHDRQVLLSLMRSFMGRPSEAEAEAYGRYAFNDDVTGREDRPIAAALQPGEVREMRLFTRLMCILFHKEHPPLISAWPEGCLALTKEAGRTDRIQTIVYKYLMYVVNGRARLIGDKGKRS